MIIKDKNGLSFELEQNNYTATIISSPDARGNIIVPCSVNYQSHEYIITSIQPCSFKNNDNLISLTFADDSQLRSIGRKAFSYSFIETLSLPSTVDDLEEGWCACTRNLYRILLSPDNKRYKYYDDTCKVIVGKSDMSQEDYDVLVFASRDVNRMFIPSSIKHISSFAFGECNINKIEYEESTKLETIGVRAINFISLNSIFIPASVKQLKDGWLHYWYQSVDIIISPDNKNYKYIQNDEILIGKTDPTKEDFDVIVYAKPTICQVFIPNFIKHIGSDAFSQCSKLNKIQFEENSQLISIGNRSFASTQIKNIFIPSSVKRIGKNAFFCCKCLQMIDIPLDSELCSISKSAFFDTNITSIKIAPNVKELKDCWCSKITKLNKVLLSSKNHNFSYLNGSNKKIIVGKSDQNSDVFDAIVFACRDIKYAVIPSYIKHISPFAFSYCLQLESIVFDKNSQLQSIGRNAFSNSSLKSIKIPSSLKEISSYAFYCCYDLESLIIPEDSELLTIKRWAFYSTKIKNIFIPSKVNNLENPCFEYMKCLNDIKISPDNKTYAFIDSDNNHNVVIYKSDPSNENYDSIAFSYGSIQKVVIPSFIKKINSYCFSSCKDLISVEFEENSQLEVIYDYAFSESHIEVIKIPKNINFIGKSAFAYCHRLRYVDFEEGSKLEFINDELFESSAIDSLSIPICVSEIRRNWCSEVSYLNDIYLSPFNNCFTYSDKQKKIILGKSDQKSEIFDVLIFACRNIKKAVIPETIKYINPNAFYYCKIESIYIPKSVIKIRKNAFCRCGKLKSVKFGEEGEKLTICNMSFAATDIEFISIPSKVLKIENDSFMECDLKSFEFLGDEISIDKLARNKDSFIASFPNAHVIFINESVYKNAPGNFSLFIIAGTKINYYIINYLF